MQFTTTPPPTRLMTNQNHWMMESAEQEPTSSCAVLKKACNGKYGLVAVACMIVEAVNSVTPSVVSAERRAILLKSAVRHKVTLQLNRTPRLILCPLSRSIGGGTSTMKEAYQKTTPIVCIYTKRNHVPIVGILLVQVRYKKFSGHFNLLIVEGHRTSLIGLGWFAALGIDIIGVNHTSRSSITDLV
ncbi:UNVERIFIED_CONTAM: hypothetical protein K2H54_057042 [Gekko kuhli]